jgi:hypothetical protein
MLALRASAGGTSEEEHMAARDWPRDWPYGDDDREDLPIRDRPYERYGQQGIAMPTYIPEPYRPEEDDLRHAHDAQRIELGEPISRSDDAPPPSTARGPRGWRRSDERLHDEICARLTDDAEVDPSDVEVVVHEGEVSLLGTVRDRNQRERARRLAETVRGVVDVINRVRVR